MVRELHKKSKGIEGLVDIEEKTQKQVDDIEKIRSKDYNPEMDLAFYFSVVFNTRDERDGWLKKHNIKLEDDFFVKAENFNL